MSTTTQCRSCQAPFEPRREGVPQVYCSIRCRQDARNERDRAKAREKSLRVIVCETCGVPVETRFPRQRFCSETCFNRHDEMKQRRRRYQTEHDDRVSAHRKVNKALRTGDLVRPDVCNRCGQEARLDAHHEDYSRPLDVEWLCRTCHRRHHLAA